MTSELFAISNIARLVHEANRTYASFLGQNFPAFDDAPEQVQQDTMNAVIHQLNNPENTAESNHKEWLAAQQKDGWAHGPNDPLKKTHPCMMEYSFLPVEQKIKDALFHTLVNQLRPVFDAFCILHDLRNMEPAPTDEEMDAIDVAMAGGDTPIEVQPSLPHAESDA